MGKIEIGDKVRVTKGSLKGAVGTYYGGGDVHSEGIGWSHGWGTSDLERVDPSTPDCDAGGKPPTPLRPHVAKWLADNPDNRNAALGRNPYRGDIPEGVVVENAGLDRIKRGKYGKGWGKR